jgi:Family of unknown function (DUF6535)
LCTSSMLVSYQPRDKDTKEAPTTDTAAENLGADEKQAPQTKPEDHDDSGAPHKDSGVVPAESHDMDEYDERATKLWSVYVEEAESHDKALIETWKDDMEGIIIFVRVVSHHSRSESCAYQAGLIRPVCTRQA